MSETNKICLAPPPKKCCNDQSINRLVDHQNISRQLFWQHLLVPASHMIDVYMFLFVIYVYESDLKIFGFLKIGQNKTLPPAHGDYNVSDIQTMTAINQAINK